MSESRIRQGQSADIARIVEIYNHYVTETHVTFDTEPFAVGARTQWFSQFSDAGPQRLYVAEDDGAVVGYTCSSQFKPRPGYNTSVETAVYVRPENTGAGVGVRLYQQLLDALEAEPTVHRAYGGVALPNPQSVAMHERLGFKKVATFHEVGFKFDRYWDVSWFEKEV